MSVVIKGVEMPTGNPEEPTAVWIYPDGRVKVFCNCGNSIINTHVVPIPPHGRLIDAVKLIEALKNPPLYRSLAGMCLDDVIGMINDAPTIIPAEEGNLAVKREHEVQVEMAQYCERYELTYNPDTGAL